MHAALRAQDEGYDAFLIATIPDTGYEECRALVDIPVVAFGQTSVLLASTLGSTVGIVNFIGALEPQLRRNLRTYGLDAVVGPIRQVAAEFTDVMRAYADPDRLLEAFRAAAREAIGAGATVIVPGEGPLNVFLADHGVSRVDDVPVVDSIGTRAPGGRDAGPSVPHGRPRPVTPRLPPRAAAARPRRPCARLLRRHRRARPLTRPLTTAPKEPDVQRGHRGRRRRRGGRRLRRHDGAARLGEPGRRRRGAREEPAPRAATPGCPAAASRPGVRGSRPRPASTDSPQRHAARHPRPHSGDERHRDLVEALCTVAARLRALDRRRPRLPDGRRLDMARKGMSVPRLHADPRGPAAGRS